MIKIETQPICHESDKFSTDYLALYSLTEDADIDEGVVLTACMDETYIFQVDKQVNVFSASSIEYSSGSLLEYLEEGVVDLHLSSIPMRYLRYPTKEELEWYNKQNII